MDNTITDNSVHGLYICSATITSNLISGNTTANGSLYACHGTLSDNIISGNTATDGGGLNYCSGSVTGNIILGNTATNDGGGLYNCNGTITGNVISGNRAANDGGALHNCDGTISGNVISGNTATNNGGGLCLCYMDAIAIAGNTIVGNTAGGDGGGLYKCNMVTRNNIIAFNRADTGGGIYESHKSSYNVFWDNLGGDFAGGAYGGPGDFHKNPQFAVDGYWDDPCGTPGDILDDVWVDGEYYLKSTAGRWDPNTQSWGYDDVNSPCIDAGDPSDSVGSESNPNGGRINIGVYGGTTEASKSPSGIVEPVCTEYPPMDYNKDCKVGFEDFAMFCEGWLECNLDPPEACWE